MIWAWITLPIAGLHLAWAVLMMVSEAAFGSTPTSGIGAGWGRSIAPVMLAIISLLAFWSAGMDSSAIQTRTSRVAAIVLLYPQQYLLYLSVGSALNAVWSQSYADGVPRPFAFIAVDQLPMIFLGLTHTAMLVWRSWRLWR